MNLQRIFFERNRRLDKTNLKICTVWHHHYFENHSYYPNLAHFWTNMSLRHILWSYESHSVFLFFVINMWSVISIATLIADTHTSLVPKFQNYFQSLKVGIFSVDCRFIHVMFVICSLCYGKKLLVLDAVSSLDMGALRQEKLWTKASGEVIVRSHWPQ